MLSPLSAISSLVFALLPLTQSQSESTQQRESNDDLIPFSARAHWIRRAITALSDLESPCAFQAFGTAIVNHTDSTNPLGTLICIGANEITRTGNPILHGEIAAINNCSSVLGGEYGLSPVEIAEAWKDLSLYTTAEACPMCASAIRWAGFKEYIYATSMDFLFEKGWSQISISSREVFERSTGAGGVTRLLGGVLANETDGLFEWQFDASKPCPEGCERNGGSCTIKERKVKEEL